MDEMPDTVDALLTVKHQVEAHGLRLAAVEGGPPMDLIVQGMDGRDEQIEHYKTCIRAMGEAGISILCKCSSHIHIHSSAPITAHERTSARLHTYIHTKCNLARILSKVSLISMKRNVLTFVK